MKHLKNLLSQPSAGKASAAVVGQPSAHRRYSRLKHLALMLCFLLGSLNVWGADVIVTLDNIGTSLTSTANTTASTADIIATGTEDEYTLNYYQCKKQGSAMFMTKSVNPYISNKTPMPGNIKSVEVFINSGASGKTTYNCAFSATECNAANAATGVGAVKITGGNSNTFEADVEGKYFLITLGNANNGQVLKLVITCDGESGSGQTGDSDVPVTGVTLDGSSITLTVDETQTLEATVTPDDATNKNVAWESSDEAVATVSNAGLVTAVGAGDATITCKSVADDTKFATCAVHVNASPYTKSTLIFTAACGGSGTASDGAEWIVTSDGSESTFDNAKGIHYGTGSGAVQYIQLATSDIEGTIAKVVVNASTASGVSATASVTIGGDAFGGDAQSLTGTAAEYTFTGSASGKIIVLVTKPSSATKAIYVKSIVVYYIAAPSKTPAGLAYADADLSKLVKLGASFTAPTLDNPNSLSVAYTSSNTDVAEVAANGAVTIKAVGVAEITASSEETETYKAGSAKYKIYVVAHEGTEADPYTVADARVVIDKGETGIADQYVKGIVSKIVTAYNSEYGNITYEISDDGTTEAAQLRAFRGFDKDGAWFTSEDDVMVGDEVVVKGQFAIYGTIYELDANNQLVSLNRTKTVAGLEYAETAIEKNIGDAAFTNTLTNPNSLEVSYSSTATDVATVDENGEVTIVGMGTTTIKATFAGNASYLADEVSYTLTVNDPSLVKVTFDATVDIASDNAEGITKNGVNIKASHVDGVNGSNNPINYYQCFKNETFTATCTLGDIKRIEFSCTSSNPASGFGASYADGVWTGSAAVIELKATEKQVQMNTVTVYYKVDARAEAGLAYETTAIDKHVGDAAFVNTLTNPNNLAVAYESSNTDVAEVANDGTVTIKAEGTATITASFEGNEDYKPASVYYTLTINEAGLDNVTFDATSDYTADASTLTLSKGGFTLTFTSGVMNNQSEYRLYQGQTMTLSSSDYIIKKIEFVCSSGNPITGFDDETGLDKTNNRWTGKANKVELTASNKQVRIEQMIVYYVEDTRAASGLAWSTDEVEITLGDAFTPANLVNPNSIDASAITIASDNTDLAVVNDGVVSLEADATGTAHITATFAGNDDYKPATASYTIIVNDPTPTIYVDKLNVNFTSVKVGNEVPAAQTISVTLTNVAAVTATLGGDNADAFGISTESLTESGDITISVLANTDAAASYSATLTISDGEEGAADKTVNLSFEVVVEDDVTGTWTLVTDATTLAAGKKVIIAQYVEADGAINTMAAQKNNNRGVIASTVAGTTLTPADGTKVMTLADAGEGKFYLMTSDGEYLYNASTSGTSYLRTKEEADDASWTIAANAQGKATITSVENTNRTIMRYNENGSNPALFNCYASGQSDIALYMLEETTPEPVYENIREGAVAGKYYTICLSKKVVAFRGGSFWTLNKRSASVAYLEEVTGVLPAGTPYIFSVSDNKLEVVYEGEATSTAQANGALRGTFADLVQEEIDGIGQTEQSDIYLLSNNTLWNVTATGSSNNKILAGRAYIVFKDLHEVTEAPQSVPGRRVVAMPMHKDNTTGIDAVNMNVEGVQKVVVDGHMYIVRDGKMFDATGRLVK